MAFVIFVVAVFGLYIGVPWIMAWMTWRLFNLRNSGLRFAVFVFMVWACWYVRQPATPLPPAGPVKTALVAPR